MKNNQTLKFFLTYLNVDLKIERIEKNVILPISKYQEYLKSSKVIILLIFKV